MHPYFQDIFVTSDDHQALRYEGAQDAACWADGVLKTSDGKVYAQVENGVPMFVPPGQDPWGDDDEAIAKSLNTTFPEEYRKRRETLIPTNWQKVISGWQHAETHHPWIERVTAHGGLMLIVACGPGGSHAPGILHINPEAKLLMDDIGRWIMQDTKRFADKQGSWPYLSFAQFDARRFPIRSDCLDCIDSSVAMAEIDGSFLTMQEALRVLKPGGKLFLSEFVLDPDCFDAFPEEGKRELRERVFHSSDVGMRYGERLLSLGFNVLTDQSTPITPYLGESDLVEIGAKYRIPLKMLGVNIEAQKP